MQSARLCGKPTFRTDRNGRLILHLKLDRLMDSPGESPGALAADSVLDTHPVEEALRTALSGLQAAED